MDCDHLILQIAKQDMSALETLYQKMYASVFGFILSMVQDAAVAADLAQDTFLQVYHGAKGFKSQGQGRAWILRIAKNLSLNELKRRKHASAEFGEMPAYTPDVDTMMHLKQMLSSLSSSERKIVMLKAYGYSHKEIAQTLRIPQGTVRWRYASAMKHLRKDSVENDKQHG